MIQAGEFEWGWREKKVCFLKEEADSINPVSSKIPARGMFFPELVWHFTLGCLSFNKQNNMNRKVCTENCFVIEAFWCTFKNCSVLATWLRLVKTKPKDSFILRHTEKPLPISQALNTKCTIYRCGLSQFSVLIPFWQYTSSLQVHASCQLHLRIILPEARIKDHTWSSLA